MLTVNPRKHHKLYPFTSVQTHHSQCLCIKRNKRTYAATFWILSCMIKKLFKLAEQELRPVTGTAGMWSPLQTGLIAQDMLRVEAKGSS